MSIEFRHKFSGSSGTLLAGLTPEVGSAWASDSANMFPGSSVKLDGLGFTYNGNASASSLILAQGTFAGSTHQVRWPMCFRSDLGSLRTAGVAFYTGSASSPDDCRFNWAQGEFTLTLGAGNGSPVQSAYAFPAAGTTPEFRATLIDGTSIKVEMSTDYGVTWADLFGGAVARSAGISTFRPGIWYDGGMSAATGVQVGNLRIGATPLASGLSVSPAAGTVGGNVSVTFTAPAAGWHPGSGLPALSVTAGGTGASVGTQAVTDFDSRTAVVACGSAAGTLTIADPSGGTTSFTVAPAGPTTATLANTPTTCTVGLESAQVVVTLDAPAPSGGTVVNLASNGSGDAFHATAAGGSVASITIAQGQTSGHFYLVAGSTGSRNVSITSSGLTIVGSPLAVAASSGGSPPTTLTVAGPATITEGFPATFTATLDNPAGPGGVSYTPAATVFAAAFSPSPVVFAQGQTVKTFTATSSTAGSGTVGGSAT